MQDGGRVFSTMIESEENGRVLLQIQAVRDPNVKLYTYYKQQ